jgi:glycosyltransferase involved in cell wall biosynthesis
VQDPLTLGDIDRPERRLVAEMEESHDPALGSLRVSLALGGYLLGRLDRFEACELSGQPQAAFDLLVAASAVAGGAVAAGSQARTGPAPQTAQRPMISVVIPVLNEADNLPLLYEQLKMVLESLGTHEIVFVDDGSSDASVDIILSLRSGDHSVKLLRLSRNFGHQAALSAGLDHARGEAVVLMDADMQDSPQVLGTFVEQWKAGHEVVFAIRTKRSGSILKRLCYSAFYRLLRGLARIDIPLDSGDFCLIDRRVADAIRQMPERNRFLRGLRAWSGFRQVGVPCERPARYAGTAKYTWVRLVRLGLDGLLAFSTVPLRLGSYLGLLTALAGMVYILVALVAKIFVGHVPAGWTSIIAIVLVLGGVQLVLMGLLGEYLARVYEETKDRPIYIVDRAYGIVLEA